MDINQFVCPVCGNSDIKMIGIKNGKPYCRKCISFKGKEADNSKAYPKRAYYKLSYELTDDQIRLSETLITNYKHNKNTLVHAVCGAGKTEIVLEVIKYAIECGDTVGFAVPRRDVAIELCDRFKEIFKFNKIALVYGGHTDKLSGDLTCLTTHQLYRYPSYFDLLIVDEIDAFPFKNNEVLQAFFEKSIKGKYIMMSATPDEKTLNNFKKEGFEIVELFSRFHEHPLPVPHIEVANKLSSYFLLIKYLNKYIKNGKQTFVFCPTIELCESTYRVIKCFCKDGYLVHSKRKDRKEIIQDFRNKKYTYLCTTAVLERGVTVKDLQVIVFNADHKIYDSYSLIQIAGRAGRKRDAPKGDVIFITKEVTDEITRAQNEIITANKNLQSMF